MPSRSGLRLVKGHALLTARGNAELFRRAAVPALLQMGRESTGSIREKIMAERHDRGILANAVTPLPPVVAGLRAELAVVAQPPGADYATVVEERRSPGRRAPPREAILAWLLRTDKGKRLLTAFRKTLNIRRAQRKGAALSAIEAELEQHGAGRRATLKRLKGRLRASRRRLPSNEELAVRLSFLLAHSIGRKGTPGIQMFARTASEMGAGRAMRIYRQHVARAKAEMGG